MESIIKMKIDDSIINSKMTKTQIVDFLIAHKQIHFRREEFKQDRFTIEDRNMYMHSHNGTCFISICIEFEDECIISMERTTKEYHVFELGGKV